MLWPFGAVLASLRFYNAQITKNIIWLFVIFYGYTFVLSNDTMDANRIKEKFEYIYFNNFSFSGLLQYFLLDNEDSTDIVQPIIFYFVSKFTTNFYILMAVLGAIFGYFYSRNFCYILDRSGGKVSSYNYILLFLFIVVIGFWDINRFRFATATMIFLYATLPYLYEGNKKRLWLIFLSFLVHFSYLFPATIFVIYLILKNRSSLYFWTFIVSFFLVSVDASAVGEILVRLLPSNLHYKVMAYTNEEYVLEQAENIKSISYIMRYLMFFIINTLFAIFYLKFRNQIKSDVYFNNLFCFTLLIMAATNFISIVPSGIRFLSLSALFSLTFMFFYFQRYGIPKKYKLLLDISVPVFIISSLGYLRLGLNTIDIIMVIGNPIIALYDTVTRVALIDLLR